MHKTYSKHDEFENFKLHHEVPELKRYVTTKAAKATENLSGNPIKLLCLAAVAGVLLGFLITKIKVSK